MSIHLNREDQRVLLQALAKEASYLRFPGYIGPDVSDDELGQMRADAERCERLARLIGSADLPEEAA